MHSAFLFLLLLAQPADELPDGPGKATFLKACGGCHGADAVTGMGHDRKGWKEIVDDMVEKGAPVNSRQSREIVTYLARAFPQKPRK